MPKKLAQGLLPETYAEFRSVEFWDGFFKTRGERAFEWYGDWRQLQAFIKDHCTKDSSILVPGCGNSELSAAMYDAGFQKITNMDFSKLLIMSMMKKHLRQRPAMKWLLGDMTCMKLADSSFDIIIDKGGLDALMGEDAEEGSEAGQKFLSEVQRVLKQSGVYLCFSLLQSHVLNLLLSELSRGFQMDFKPVPPTPDMARASLQPMFVSAKRRRLNNGQSSSTILTSSIDASSKAPNAAQLEEIHQEHQMKQKSSKKEMVTSQMPESGQQSADDFANLAPGRRALVDLSPAEQGKPKEERSSGSSRFTATVLDVEEKLQRIAVQQCCVFMIPQGREPEWLFASVEGQLSIAKQCKCKRLILVALGRGHTFGTWVVVQDELSPLVRNLAPKSVRKLPKGIPIMAMQDAVGKRTVLCSEASSISGQIVVEDVEIHEGEENVEVRRLVFVANSSLIQSEAQVIPGKNGKAGEVDPSRLCMNYHKHILAGLLQGKCIPEGPASDRSVRPPGVLIGLGGGALAVFLCHFLQMDILAIELDPSIVDIAKQFFGLQTSEHLKVTMGDGLLAVENLGENFGHNRSLKFLIVDAGSNDNSLAMSCPPPAFLQPEFLKATQSLLQDSGLLVVNCVTRSEEAFQQALASIKEVFENVVHSAVEEDVNRVIFAGRKMSDFKSGLRDKAAISKVLNAYANDELNHDKIADLASSLSDIELV